MQPKARLLTEIIDAQTLFEIIQEEQTHYFDSECDVDLKRIECRIKQARSLTKNYLTILN